MSYGTGKNINSLFLARHPPEYLNFFNYANILQAAAAVAIEAETKQSHLIGIDERSLVMWFNKFPKKFRTGKYLPQTSTVRGPLKFNYLLGKF